MEFSHTDIRLTICLDTKPNHLKGNKLHNEKDAEGDQNKETQGTESRDAAPQTGIGLGLC